MNSQHLRLIRRAAGISLFIAIALWAFRGSEFALEPLIDGVGRTKKILGKMTPPDTSVLRDALEALMVTLQMAISGTIIGALLAVPASFVAGRTGLFPLWMSSAVKLALSALRGVPPLVYAIILVWIVGLGKFPAALGIAVGVFVMLAKLYSEALESVNPGPIEAVQAAGGSRVQVFGWGMLPQAVPHYIAHSLYAWEGAIGSATILGVVGAGGIGKLVVDFINLGQWRQAAMTIVVLVCAVLVVDTLSFQIRRRII